MVAFDDIWANLCRAGGFYGPLCIIKRGLIRPYTLISWQATWHSYPAQCCDFFPATMNRILRSRRFLTTSSTPTSNSSSLAQKTKEYGLLSIIVYSTLSFSTFCGCLFSISKLELTSKDFTNGLNKVRIAVGMDPVEIEEAPAEKEESRIYKHLPDWAKTEQAQRVATNVLLAMGMTKLFAPVKIGLTAMIVPSLARKLKSVGWMRNIK